MEKIGLFGGTFNPIHLGHARLAYNVYKDLGLDSLVFIPSKLPPHKAFLSATPKERYEMTVLMARTLEGNFSVSDFELKSEGISYTYLTLKEWRRRYPEAALFFITGSDIFSTVETWQNCFELFELANFVVVNRGISFDKLRSDLPEDIIKRVVRFDWEPVCAGRILLYRMDPVKVSSTMVREQLAKLEGKSINFNEELHEDVYKYIWEKNLYEGGNMESVKLLRELIEDKLGEDIISFDLRGISSITDYLVIATGKADTHVKAVSEHVITEMKKNGIPPLAYEGLTEGVWVCVDFGDIILHIMRSAEREYYNLEGIWGAAPRVG
jgi:nicotinate-nucleotide adenylyltransferase